MLLPERLNGVLVEARRFDIHDQPNWNVAFKLDGDETVHDARPAVESGYPEPRPGDRIVVHLVLGEAAEIRRE